MAFDLDLFRQEVLADPLVYDAWDQKYRWKEADGTPLESTVAETRERVVRAIFAKDPSLEAYGEALYLVQNGFLVPAGRVNAGAGLSRAVTLNNCYVAGTLQDSMYGIQKSIMEVSLTMQQGGGDGSDFSTIRPRFALVKRTGSVASGVISFMDEQDAMCSTIVSGGNRRGAMMGTLICDHPDLWNERQFETMTTFNGTVVLSHPSFISAKRQKNRLSQFNVSVLITDRFMSAIENDEMWDLGFHVPRADGNHVDVYDRPFTHDEINYDNEGRSTQGRRRGELVPWFVYTREKARRIWDDIMHSTYVYAEPGVIFIDQINKKNNLAYCEAINCTNPCGEQPLPEHGTCCLSSVNTAFMVTDPFTPRAAFDFNLFRRTARSGVRFLDNVLTVTNFPLEAQRLESDQKRRVGLGVTGWGDALVQLGVTYGSDESVTISRKVSEALQEASYLSSTELAHERGPFPLYNAEKMEASFNFLKLPSYVRKEITAHGLRNGVLNTVAPNGTISLYSGNVSSGIEPIFSTGKATRKVRQPDGSFKEYAVIDYAQRMFETMHPGKPLPAYFVGAHDVAPRDHVRVLAAWQGNVDAAISKTINCPSEMLFEEFEDIYRQAYALGAKGCTTYRPDPTSGRGSVLTEEVTAPLELVHADGREAVRPRPDVVPGRTYKVKWPQSGSNIYLTITNDDGFPLEVFIKHSDPLVTEWTDGLSRMITGILRRGGDVKFIVEQLQQVGSSLGGSFMKGRFEGSQVAAIGSAIEAEFRALGIYGTQLTGPIDQPSLIDVASVVPIGTLCPKCHAMSLIRETGCKKCLSCGHEECG